jgi:glyoxylase-like metal-dependent hydrolase (beta-lactamase superfamily II)
MTTVTRDENLQIDSLSLGPYGTNCYILSCRQTGESVLVDAPAEAEKILEHIKGLDPKYIIITHNHMDHLEAFSELKANLGVPVAIHPQDAGQLPSQPEVLLEDGDYIRPAVYAF